MPKSKTTSGPAISRALHKAGFGIVTTRLREGLLVTGGRGRGSFVTVTAQFATDTMAARRANNAADALRELGYEVRQDGGLLFVQKQSV